MRFAVAIAVLLLMPSGLPAENPLPPREPTPVITGPTSVYTGAMIRLSAEKSDADHYSWLVDTSDVELPPGGDPTKINEAINAVEARGFKVIRSEAGEENPTFSIQNGGRDLFLSSYPGTYRVFLAVSIDGVGVAQTSWTVKVKECRGPPDEPDPPKPPEPPDEPDPPTTGFGLAAKVPVWLTSVPQEHRSNSAAIKESLSAVGKIAGTDILPTVSGVKTALLASLTLSIKDKSAWAKFGQSLATELEKLQSAGTITTAKQFGEAILEVAGAM